MLMYFPPRPWELVELTHHMKVVDRMLDWAVSTLQLIPSDTTPVIMMDLNDEFEYVEGDSFFCWKSSQY